jgi:hypothetical protein
LEVLLCFDGVLFSGALGPAFMGGPVRRGPAKQAVAGVARRWSSSDLIGGDRSNLTLAFWDTRERGLGAKKLCLCRLVQ